MIIFNVLAAEEIPKPTYDNSLMFSITHNFLVEQQAEIDIIKNQFGNGIYAPLLFSDFIGINMDWQIDITNPGSGIQAFKEELDQMIAFAKQNKVGIHLTLTYGLTRFVDFYKKAKEEDIRNAQWYNDNNISAASQADNSIINQYTGYHHGLQENTAPHFPFDFNHIDGENNSVSQPAVDDSVINNFVFATLSRYARKLRAHVNAKVSAALGYIKQVQAANPGITIIISAPGEVELNYNRINQNQFLQDYFCDYSPFAVLEFRDWLQHTGLYADNQEYGGEGYDNGGARYLGSQGLANFKKDFGVTFTTWDLKYFDWSLADPVDDLYTDDINPDLKAIPLSHYTHGGMMPGSGPGYITGGFDPPRVMSKPGENAFYDLWNTFRETMVHHFVQDMAKIARESGFPANQYYSHQIPGDYLFGTRPNDSSIPYLNPRYYSSASPLWTADVHPDNGLGITLYDINFGTWIARTTLYGIEAADALSNNWAALEYNPEVIPKDYTANLSTVQALYNQMMKLYNGNPHVISFFKWKGEDYQFKDTNRGAAAKNFFNAIKDKARRATSTVFSPKAVAGFSATFNNKTGLVYLNWSKKIWTDRQYNWADWGDFKEFVIYRGKTANFTPNAASEIARKSSANSIYIDYQFTHGTRVYYKIAAVNSKGVSGPISSASVFVPVGTFNPILAVDKTQLNFGYITRTENPPVQYFRVLNDGTGILNWTISDDAPWLVCSPSTGLTGSAVEVYANVDSLSPGTYNGTITVSSEIAENSPQKVNVYLIVKRAVNDRPPIGELSTPVDGSSVSSSIPVTGWALDDIAVKNIKIYREPLVGEGLEMIYIGDALLVEGARPDLEIAYNDYPFNYKGGWGYMLLSHFLPNGGNGTYKLCAIAEDIHGNKTTLGYSTIICDNEHAVKPFGAIDAPGPGGIASGTKFRNQGWALASMPNAIPIDGSTINVYIDGVAKGKVVYNVVRSDIAALFNGYINSSNAGGYFEFDTTRYADGIHTIAWVAADNAGNSDGIGSRYFIIQNMGESASLPTNANDLPVFDQPLKTSTANFEKNPGFIQIRELERVEMNIGFNCRGYQVIKGQLKSLPVGSTLDSANGIFYWQPGPGFIGEYQFKFIAVNATEVGGKAIEKTVKIKILPRFSPGKKIARSILNAF
jgi:hypothetical protein